MIFTSCRMWQPRYEEEHWMRPWIMRRRQMSRVNNTVKNSNLKVVLAHVAATTKLVRETMSNPTERKQHRKQGFVCKVVSRITTLPLPTWNKLSSGLEGKKSATPSVQNSTAGPRLMMNTAQPNWSSAYPCRHSNQSMLPVRNRN